MSASKSSRFVERSSAGEVVASFGAVDNAVWKGTGQGCSVAPYDSTRVLTKQYMYMFQKLSANAHGENQNLLLSRNSFASVCEYCKPCIYIYMYIYIYLSVVCFIIFVVNCLFCDQSYTFVFSVCMVLMFC